MPPLSPSCSVAAINTSVDHDLAPALPARPSRFANRAAEVDLFAHRRLLIGNLARLVDDHLKDLDPRSILARDVQRLRDSDGRVLSERLDFTAPLGDLIDVAARAIACARQTLRLDEVNTFLLRQEWRQPLPASEQVIVSHELKHARTALALGDAEEAAQCFRRIERIRIQALGCDADPLPALPALSSTAPADRPSPIPPRRLRSIEPSEPRSVASGRAPRSDLVYGEAADMDASMKQKFLGGLNRIGQAVRSIPHGLRTHLSPAHLQRARIDRAIDQEIPLVPMREELKPLKADIHRAGV